MSAALASSAVGGGVFIPTHSQNANICASPVYRRIDNDAELNISHLANMNDADDKNGGPNHLRAWMRFRNFNGQQLAAALGDPVTPGMVSDLVNSKRALSAKWLRRLAPILDTTPGTLLDHDPTQMSGDIIDIWSRMDLRQRQQIVDIAKTITGIER